MPYLVEAADGTVLATAEDTYGRAESTARLYVGEKRVETRVLEWRETAHGPKVRELWCATDYPASVRFAAVDPAPRKRPAGTGPGNRPYGRSAVPAPLARLQLLIAQASRYIARLRLRRQAHRKNS